VGLKTILYKPGTDLGNALRTLGVSF
jgi:hypothetical protein